MIGFAIGSIGGAISGKLTDIGVDAEMMKQLGAQFQPGTSALFLLVRKATPDKVLDEVKEYSGTVLRSSLTREQEEALNEALSGESGA